MGPIVEGQQSAPYEDDGTRVNPIRDDPGVPIGEDPGETPQLPTSFEVVDWELSWREPCPINPFNPPSRLVRIRNRRPTHTVSILIETTPDWLAANPASLTLGPGSTETFQLRLDPATTPTFGSFVATVRMMDAGILFEEIRSITITLGGLCVTPSLVQLATGVMGGELSPSFAIYRLEHTGGEDSDDIEWIATTEDAWIQVGRSDPTAGRLEPGERATVAVSFDRTLLELPTEIGSATSAKGVVKFEDRILGESIEREISASLVWPVGVEEMRAVPASAIQPGGPDYSFQVGRYPVTNQAFATFLNDALANLGTIRGSAMYFDTLSGDVYVHDSVVGTVSEGDAEHSVKILSMADAPGLEFVDGLYQTRTAPFDYAMHPVTGVSWYGAVKYCNWLTIDQGFGENERCYSEGTSNDLSGWRPVTIGAAAWPLRDLNDAEARRLVEHCAGFRLPMDDGFGNADPTTDVADAYNEWYKAAAWNEASRRNRLYGFGRDGLASADANYRCSGDPFETAGQCQNGGTTPVGFFDGVPKDISGVAFVPYADENGFGLYDMTGNIHQWMQGRYAPSGTLDRRTLRGGSFHEPAQAASLKTTGRTLWAPPSTTHREIGFRVVRSIAKTGDFDEDGGVDFDDVPAIGICATGPEAMPHGGCQSADFDEDGDVDLHDLHVWLRTFASER